MIDPILFKDLGAKDPADVVNRCEASWDPETCAYRVLFWGREVDVAPGEGRVSCPGPPAPLGPDSGWTGPWAYAPLVLVHYLLVAKQLPPSGEWVSEKDLPGGSAFFRGPHTLPVQLVAQRFEGGSQGFRDRCRALGGTAMDLADAAFSFPLLPGIPVAALFWEADEMFGAEARLLFDRTISRHLPLDIIYALGVTLCRVLAA